MNNNINLTNSGKTNSEPREAENNDASGTPPPPPPPRIKSKQAKEITTSADGRQFKNGIELFDKNSIKEELEKSKNTNSDSKSTEPGAQENTNSHSRLSMPIKMDSLGEDKGIADRPLYSRFSMPLENFSSNESNQIPNIPKKIEALNTPTVKKMATKALHNACLNKNTELVEHLINSGADVNFTDKKGNTPLMIACKKGDLSIAKLLIENGANPNIQNKYGETALMWSFLEDVQVHYDIGSPGYKIETSLVYRPEITSLLIKVGARIDQLTTKGKSALSFACALDAGKALDLLIDKLGRFDPTDKDFFLHYPLELIFENDSSTALSVLMKRGMCINALEENVWEYIARVAYSDRHTEVIRLLLENFSSSLPLSKPGFLSRTPPSIYSFLHLALQRAVSSGNEETVRMLIGAGAKPDHPTEHEETALFTAIRKFHPKILLILLEQVGKLTYKKENGNVSDELLLAFDSARPDPLTIDTLLDFENDLAMKKGGLTYTVRFNELCNKVHNSLAASRTGRIDKEVMRDLKFSLCTDFELNYLIASNMENTIQRASTIYSLNSGTIGAPTAKQLRIAFVESIASDQRLHDVIRRDDHPAEKLYAKYAEAPEIAEKLIRRASAQAGLIIASAETELKEQQDALSGFLNNRAPAVTSNQISEFMQEEGWHPLLISLVVDAQDSLEQNQASDRLFNAIRNNLDAAEFIKKIEQLPSDAARHLLTQQMNRLIAIINA
jgi:ankyrin repeat protein